MNIEPEDTPLEEKSSAKPSFSGSIVNLRGCNIFNKLKDGRK